MCWYVLFVVFACFAGLDRRVTCQYDGLSMFSYNTYHGNELENTATNEMTEEAAEMDVFRLPTDIVPLSYGLEVATEFANFTYTGKVEIVVQTTTKACQIVLNAKDILVTEVQVIDLRSNIPLNIAKYYLVDKNEQLVIELNDTIRCLTASRPYVVKVTFEASLRNDMSGYYKSSYKENNVTKYCIVNRNNILFDIFYYLIWNIVFYICGNWDYCEIKAEKSNIILIIKLNELGFHWFSFDYY